MSPHALGLDSVRLASDGWRVCERGERDVLWQDADDDFIRVTLFPNKTELPSQSLVTLRDYFRGVALSNNGGVVSVDVQSIAGVPCVRNIFKFLQKPHGMVALGSLVIPRRDVSWVIRVQCPEVGVAATGMREAGIMAQHLHLQKASGDDPLEGWMFDPYDPTRKDPLMRNLADDEKYDEAFPWHPLARVRRKLADIRETTRIDAAVSASAAFPLPTF